jgi:ATP-dependent Clp protease ATP-binding subunit ClpA
MSSCIRNLKYKLQDMGTITDLAKKAEDYAHRNGEEIPGAEHFLLAALSLPDATARNVFERLGADPERFESAINEQYHDALRSVGIEANPELFEKEEALLRKEKRKLYHAKPSVQDLMKKLVSLESKKNMPLLGAHIVEVLAANEQGVAARAFKTMGIDAAALMSAVADELRAFSKVH